MTTTPDPQTVREIAREIILKHAKHWDAQEIRYDYRADPRCARLSNPEFIGLRGALIDAIVGATVTVSWPDEPQDPQPWPRAQRMPLAIVGQRVQPWHIQAIAAYDEATGSTTLPHSNLPGMYAAAQVNQAITWWNERVEAEQSQDERDGDVRTVRALTQAASRMLGMWAEANEAVRHELWTTLHDRADDVFDRYRDQYAALDAEAVASLEARDAKAGTDE